MKKTIIIAIIMLATYARSSAQSITLNNHSACSVTLEIWATDAGDAACHYQSNVFTMAAGCSFSISSPTDLNPPSGFAFPACVSGTGTGLLWQSSLSIGPSGDVWQAVKFHYSCGSGGQIGLTTACSTAAQVGGLCCSASSSAVFTPGIGGSATVDFY